MYHVSAQGVDERMINVHYYYYRSLTVLLTHPHGDVQCHEVKPLVRDHHSFFHHFLETFLSRHNYFFVNEPLTKDGISLLRHSVSRSGTPSERPSPYFLPSLSRNLPFSS